MMPGSTVTAMNSRRESTVAAVLDRKESSGSPEKPSRRPDLSLYEIDDELLIYDETAGNTHHLNGTARFIWDRCNGHRDADAVAADLADVYDVPMSEASSYVESLIAELLRRRLLVAAD